MSPAILPLTQKRECTLIVWEIRSHNSPIWGWGGIRKLATVVLPYVFWSHRSVRFPAHTCHAWAFYYSIIVFIFILAPHLFTIRSLGSSSHCVSKSCTQDNKSCFPYKNCTFASGNILLCIFPWKALSTAPTKAVHKHGRPSKTHLNWTEVPVSPQN